MSRLSWDLDADPFFLFPFGAAGALEVKLTEEEVAILEFSDDEDLDVVAPVVFTLVGKVLSPTPVHVTMVRSAMKAAWSNPVGLKIREIGDKGDNMFVV